MADWTKTLSRQPGDVGAARMGWSTMTAPATLMLQEGVQLILQHSICLFTRLCEAFLGSFLVLRAPARTVVIASMTLRLRQ